MAENMKQKIMTDQQIQEKMVAISELIEQGKESEDIQVGTINYYKDFIFQGSNLSLAGRNFKLAETNIYIAKIENIQENTNTYEIYSGNTNMLIATVDEQGKLHLMPEYIERLKQIEPRILEILNLEGLEFRLPQELEKEDRVMTRAEREHLIKEGRAGNAKKEDKQLEEKEQEGEEQEAEKGEKTPEEEQKEKIAKAKQIPSNNVLMIRENSNLYKDHPNLEPNLYFYRDKNGTVKAEYLDSNGEPQPSKYFEDSTTSLRQETVSLGNDGNPVTKEVPYQVMRTKGLNNADKDIRDIRISITIDTYGYLEIAETRQGKNGEWLSHDIEVKGRDYNSRAVNETTSIKTRRADPDKQTNAYAKTENTGFEEDGIQYSEMYLIEHPNELIESLIKEGYQKPEAVQIFDYMIGEEALTLSQAKEKVDDEISKGEYEQERQNGDNEIGTGEIGDNNEDEERTPWGDAEMRSARNRY